MKKFICIVIISLLISNAYSQRLHSVPYYDWNNYAAFMLSPSPLITGHGFYSDSLSRAHNDTTFYEYNGVYYPITSWADYFYWYVDKYWYQFNFPELYKFYYETGNNLEMARYICGDGFKEYMYPCRIVVDFRSRDVPVNYLSSQCVKEYLKIDAKEESPLTDANSNVIQHPIREIANNGKAARNNNSISELTYSSNRNLAGTYDQKNRQENSDIHAIRASGLGRNNIRDNFSSNQINGFNNRRVSNDNMGSSNVSNSTPNYSNQTSNVIVSDTRQSTGSSNESRATSSGSSVSSSVSVSSGRSGAK